MCPVGGNLELCTATFLARNENIRCGRPIGISRDLGNESEAPYIAAARESDIEMFDASCQCHHFPFRKI